MTKEEWKSYEEEGERNRAINHAEYAEEQEQIKQEKKPSSLLTVDDIQHNNLGKKQWKFWRK
jgi:hypothetical protein